MFSLVGDNCDFNREAVISAKSVADHSACFEYCEGDTTCTGYVSIGEQNPRWCFLKGGDFGLVNATKFNGTSICGIMTCMY